MSPETSNTNLKIELCYRFDDDNKHSMNAEIFNECERHFIKGIKSVEKYFEENIQLNIKPRKEGSLIDIFTIAINNPNLTATFSTLITIFATKFFDAKFSNAKHKTEETEKKLENLAIIKDKINSGVLTESDFDYIASNDRELRKHKSNFFKSAKKDPEITKIETTATNSNSKIPQIIVIIERNEFDNLILTQTTETIEKTESAKIYIVAPILIKGRRDAWKGILENNSIDFKVLDQDFLTQVWNKEINFQNGTYINCDLKTSVTTNLETEETKIIRVVENVANYGEDNAPLKVVKHRKKTSNSKNIEQPNLFSGLEIESDNE